MSHSSKGRFITPPAHSRALQAHGVYLPGPEHYPGQRGCLIGDELDKDMTQVIDLANKHPRVNIPHLKSSQKHRPTLFIQGNWVKDKHSSRFSGGLPVKKLSLI